MRYSIILTCQNRLANLQYPIRAQVERSIQSLLNQNTSAQYEILLAIPEIQKGLIDHVETVFGDALTSKKLILNTLRLGESPQNVAASRAGGAFLAFVDAQDWWLEDRLQKIEASTPKADLVFEMPSRPEQSSDWLRTFLKEGNVLPSSVVIRHSLFDAIGGYPAGMRIPGGEEYELCLKAMLALYAQDKKNQIEVLPPQGTVVHENSFWEKFKFVQPVSKARRVLTQVTLARKLPKRYIPRIGKRQ